MNQNMPTLHPALRAVTLTLALLSFGAANAQTAMPMSPSASMPHAGGAAGPHDMKASMMKDMDAMQKMKMSGDVDKDFAMMMKMHHQQALSMAEMQLAHGKSAEMKSMARQIITAQKKEIAQFDQFLAKQK